MIPDWTDLELAVAENELLLLPGLPSGSPAAYIWSEADFVGWVRAAVRVRSGIVYAAEATVAEQADGLRSRLSELRADDIDGNFEAEADQLDLLLAEVVDRSGGQVVGWVGEWRHAGVAHHYVAIELPEPLVAIETRLEEREQVRPSWSERRTLRSGDFDERRAEMTRLKQQRSDAAAAALAADAAFPSCTNMAQRKNLLGKLERAQQLNMDGVNREDVIAAAKALLSS